MMENNSYFDTPRKKLFGILLLIQIVIGGVLIGASQFTSGLFSTIIQIIFLLAAYFCYQPGFAIIYSVFSLFRALYLVDLIGLFIVGHGYKKTLAQNILCLVAFVLCILAGYVGYLLSKEIMIDIGSAPGQDDYYQDYNARFTRPVNQPQNRTTNQNNNQPSTSYGGTNYLYQNPSGSQNAPTRTNNQPARSNWSPFSGQGYSLS